MKDEKRYVYATGKARKELNKNFDDEKLSFFFDSCLYYLEKGLYEEGDVVLIPTNMSRGFMGFLDKDNNLNLFRVYSNEELQSIVSVMKTNYSETIH